MCDVYACSYDTVLCPPSTTLQQGNSYCDAYVLLKVVLV